MHKTASFGKNQNTKLQEFADLCANVESRVAHLPGLQCLNFPNAVQPIAEKLPLSLRGKWEKEKRSIQSEMQVHTPASLYSPP